MYVYLSFPSPPLNPSLVLSFPSLSPPSLLYFLLVLLLLSYPSFLSFPLLLFPLPLPAPPVSPLSLLQPFLGSSDSVNQISGKIKLGKEVLATLEGHWVSSSTD